MVFFLLKVPHLTIVLINLNTGGSGGSRGTLPTRNSGMLTYGNKLIIGICTRYEKQGISIRQAYEQKFIIICV